MVNCMKTLITKKCLVYIVNNFIFFLLLNFNPNNYFIIKYTLSSNIILKFFTFLSIINSEYLINSILDYFQKLKYEIIIRKSNHGYSNIVHKNLIKIILLKLIIDCFINIILLNKMYLFYNIIESMILLFCFICIKKKSYTLVTSIFILIISKKYYFDF